MTRASSVTCGSNNRRVSSFNLLLLTLFTSQWWTQHHYLMTSLLQQQNINDNAIAMIIGFHNSSNAHADSKSRNSHPTTTRTATTTSNISFHRWSSPTGIDIEALWHCMRGMLPPDAPYDRYGPFPAWIGNQQAQKHQQLNRPHPLLMVSRHVYRRRRSTIRRRANFLLTFLQDAIQTFLLSLSSSETTFRPKSQQQNSANSSNNIMKRTPGFPFLLQALQEPHGIPLLFDVGDYVGCLKDNYNFTRAATNDASATTITTVATVPFFTMSSSPSCGYAFPIPSYATLQIARHPPSTTFEGEDVNHWYEVLARRKMEYPWHTKIPKAVWRGTISGRGHLRRTPLDIPRIHLNVLAKSRSDILDVAVACAKNCGLHKSWHGWITFGNFTPMESFQRYRAVIDLDGNSWSERFPKLLCQNSVVIKVEPEQIDYFAPTLQAGVHYVAAPANLTHLIAVVEYVVSDEHQEEMQQIVRNANEWCRQRMVIGQLQWDALSVLNGYAEELYKGDPNWSRYSSMDLQDFGFRYLNESMD